MYAKDSDFLKDEEKMRKDDFTVLNVICEAIGIVSAILYIGLQIYCGVLYRAGIFTIFTNILSFFFN